MDKKKVEKLAKQYKLCSNTEERKEIQKEANKLGYVIVDSFYGIHFMKTDEYESLNKTLFE
ncbi:hypothetical protein [Bacillus mobilis]|uniref:hypothetical protein n=1 Tax=Bacillus mobilis TaxID=2026190 RepID=UPI003CF90DE0